MGTKREWILNEMVKNFLYLYEKYNVIPNFNSHASVGRSQPPFFSSMILDTYETFARRNGIKNILKKAAKMFYKRTLNANKTWLKDSIKHAKDEYQNVWIDKEKKYHHSVDGFILNRYGDRDLGYAHSSELESGWDFTSRFYSRCNEFLPIDLNTLLYKYEIDFEKSAAILGDKDDELHWQKEAEKRKNEINKYMWNEKEGFFFDYGFKYKKQSDFLSLAGFVPLWAGLAGFEQAKKTAEKLKYFETPYGLTITSKSSLPPQIDLSKMPERYLPALKSIIEPKQWDYPNIWPPLEYLTIIGLLKYGFTEDVKRIIKKSLKANAYIFKKYGTFFEKLNGINGDAGADFHYKNQSGFGWTNAIFYRYIQILKFLDANESKIKNAKKFPVELDIIH